MTANTNAKQAHAAAKVSKAKDGSGFVPVNPFEIVVFGGTGDLARRKLIPALYHRFLDGQFDARSKIVAVSRSKLSRDTYLEMITEAYKKFAKDEAYDDHDWAEFCCMVDYVSIDVYDDAADWPALEAAVSSGNCKTQAKSEVKNTNKKRRKEDRVRIFYLAMPPGMYADTCEGLKRSGLATDTSRVVLEKPIGKDFESAEKINNGVGKVFDEDRIYRIDHYLGKETVQNLMVLRFANVLFEPLWSREHIDHVQITAAESIGVAGREAYYNKSGALRDMVQNHLLQLLCLTCMEAPATLDGDDIRTEKIKVLQALHKITPETAATHTVRGQYTPGVVEGEAVAGFTEELSETADISETETETFVALKTQIDNWRWAGVPIYLRTGKRMAQRWSEIVVQFKPVPHSVFGKDAHLSANRLVIRLQPDESVNLWVEIKEPGAGGLRLKSWPLDLTYDEAFTTRYPDAYERLLMDVVRGRLTLFMRRDEVEAAWRWVDSIHDAWTVKKQPVKDYPAGSTGPLASGLLIDRDGREWWDASR